MALPNIFSKEVNDSIISRIEKLQPSTTPKWGKMSASQMLAHCNVTYEMAFEDTIPRPGFIKKLLLNLFVKKSVLNEKPYPKNSPTAPQFQIKEDKNFTKEKQRLIDYINKTHSLGANHFDGKESHGFGNLSADEWNNMFYKHLQHHLEQFGV